MPRGNPDLSCAGSERDIKLMLLRAVNRQAELSLRAPVDAQYLVAATNSTLTAERVVTNTATITWDLTTPGQAKASVASVPLTALDATIGPAYLSEGSSTYSKLDPATVTRVMPTHVGGVLRSPLGYGTAQLITSGTAHWVYVGYLPTGTVVKRIRVACSVNAVGTQAAEVCLATSSTAPTGSAITVTKVWASGTVDDFTAGSLRVVGNSSDNATAMSADGHCWLGVRVAMTGGGAVQPTLHTLQGDWGAGMLAQTAAAGVFTSTSSWSATPVTITNNTSSDIRGYM